MKKSSVKIIAALALVLAASPLAAKPKFRTLDQIKKSQTIKIAVFSDKKPFGYVDENGVCRDFFNKEFNIKIELKENGAENLTNFPREFWELG